MSKHICPNCGCDEFYAEAKVVQSWRVDAYGNPIKTTENCTEVVHSPDDNDSWKCARCGWNGTGKEALVKLYRVGFNVAGSIVVAAPSAEEAKNEVLAGIRGEDTSMMQDIANILQQHLSHADVSIDGVEEEEDG